MLTFFARSFIVLGEQIADMRAMFIFKDQDKDLISEDLNLLQEHLGEVLRICDNLDLPVSKIMISEAKENPPKTDGEFEILVSALYAEIKNKLMVFIPTHRRKYFQPRTFLKDNSKDSFPKARQELAEAGRACAVGLYTATVFHSMRAVEIGLRALATELGVSFPFPINQADWESQINQIESKIRALKELPKEEEKAANLTFYSEAAMQFRYFKDGWRINVSHARETYDEPQALAVIEHVAAFFDTISDRLKEPV